jgi:hypothetical protein
VIIFPLLALALIWAMPNLLGIIAVVIFIPAAVLGFIAFVRKKTDGDGAGAGATADRRH